MRATRQKQPRLFLSLLLGSLLVSGISLTGCGGAEESEAPAAAAQHADRYPEGWDESALMALIANLDVIKTVENEIDLEVLKWKVEENDQPQRIESALVWAKYTAGESEDWMLAHVIRDATSGNAQAPWSLAVFQGTPQISHEYYEQAPTAAELTRFIRATWWDDDASGGNRLADSAVRSQAWEAAIGAPPQ